MQKNEQDSSKIKSASLIDLKAELYRKQEEYKAQKLSAQNEGYIKGKPSSSQKKPSIWSKKNKGVADRAEKDYEEKLEEENVFERSKKSLENKAKLYEKITTASEVPEEDGSQFFLVDFQKKVIDDKQERRMKERLEKEAKERQEEEEEERRLCDLPVPEPETPDEEWVDYTDSLGRSRRCLKADLPSLQKKDKDFYNAKIVPKEKAARDFDALRDKTDLRDLMSSDMHRENARQKWEQEEEAKMTQEKEGPIHYGDVLHNEIRTHGVAFYKFDQNEDKRQEQMDELIKLREQTKDERSKSERIKAKRKAALAARLSKVKQRKREKLGLPAEEDEKEDSEEEIGPKLGEAVEKEPEPLTRDDDWRKSTQSTREWDKGKQSLPERSEQEWLAKQRAERLEEFAPPTFYYTDKAAAHKTGEKRSFSETFGPDGNKIQDNKQSENSVKGNELQSIIGQQLSEMRTKLDRESGGFYQKVHVKGEHSSEQTCSNPALQQHQNVLNPTVSERNSHVSVNEKGNQSVMAPPPVSINVPPPSQPGGITTHPPYVNMSIPPPVPGNMSVPPPSVSNMLPPSTPPPLPSYNQTLPPSYLNMSTPPPPLPSNFSLPPPGSINTSVPPPSLYGNMSVMPNMMNTSIPQPLTNYPAVSHPMGGSIDVSVPPPSLSMAVNQSCDVKSSETLNVNVSTANSASTSTTRKVFVPKTSVIDTRLMANENV